MNYHNFKRSHIVSDSPPKFQRAYLQEISSNNLIHMTTRNINNINNNANNLNKKLVIEQENYNSNNIIIHENYPHKYNYINGKYPNNNNNNNSLGVIKYGQGHYYNNNIKPYHHQQHRPQQEKQQQQKSHIKFLPNELFIMILQCISPEELIKYVQYVSKRFHKICNNHLLWNTIHSNVKKLNIKSKYAIKSCIAERRSKGKLYKAISRLDNKPVLIRKVNVCVSNAGHDDGVPTSLLREISYLSTLNHQNISNIIEIELVKDIAKICTEYYDYNMREYMKTFIKVKNDYNYSHINGGRLPQNTPPTPTTEYKIPLRNIKIISFQILKGLSYLHHQGIMHRNLKSDNIVINKNDDVKICDFALSRLTTVPHIQYTPEDPKDRERSGREAKRLWYRAPELLLRRSTYSFEIDIWSFGCLIAELALNEPLFSGDSEIEQLFKIFRFVGSPNMSNWMNLTDSTDFKPMFPNWESIYFPYIGYPVQSPEYKLISSKLNPNRECAFKKLKTLNDVIGPDGLDLLWKCLALNPQMRCSADHLLKHTFFDQIHNEPIFKNLELYCPKKNQIFNNQGYSLPIMPECQLLSIHEIMKKRQIELKPLDYLPNQLNIQENMRSVLIDWLIDVSVHFEILDESLHFCVNYIDRTLSKLQVEKTKLQLIGVTCMKIADVFNEKSKEYYKQENANEYAYITADEYTAQQLIDMEKVILEVLEFKLNSSTSIHFLKIYIAYLNIPDKVSIIAKFLCDLMLLCYQVIKMDASLLASIALFVACKISDYEPGQSYIQKAKKLLAHHSKNEFEQGLHMFLASWKAIKTTTAYANYEAVYNKYQKIYQLQGKSIEIPILTLADVEKWFYMD